MASKAQRRVARNGAPVGYGQQQGQSPFLDQAQDQGGDERGTRMAHERQAPAAPAFEPEQEFLQQFPTMQPEGAQQPWMAALQSRGGGMNGGRPPMTAAGSATAAARSMTPQASATPKGSPSPAPIWAKENAAPAPTTWANLIGDYARDNQDKLSPEQREATNRLWQGREAQPAAPTTAAQSTSMAGQGDPRLAGMGMGEGMQTQPVASPYGNVLGGANGGIAGGLDGGAAAQIPTEAPADGFQSSGSAMQDYGTGDISGAENLATGDYMGSLRGFNTNEWGKASEGYEANSIKNTFGKIASRYPSNPDGLRALVQDPDFQKFFPQAFIREHATDPKLDLGDGPIDVLFQTDQGWQWNPENENGGGDPMAGGGGAMAPAQGSVGGPGGDAMSAQLLAALQGGGGGFGDGSVTIEQIMEALGLSQQAKPFGI